MGGLFDRPNSGRSLHSDADVKYLIKRLERVIELINHGEYHMAVTKLLADISALKAG